MGLTYQPEGNRIHIVDVRRDIRKTGGYLMENRCRKMATLTHHIRFIRKSDAGKMVFAHA